MAHFFASYELGELIYLALLFPAGMLAGVVNVIAGGGSFLTLPVLMAMGLPVDIANGSNRISVVLQGIYATIDFQKKGAFDKGLYQKFLPWLLVGSLLGAYLATILDPESLKRIFGVLFLVMGTCLLATQLRPKTTSASGYWARLAERTPLSIRYFSLFFVGIYGGFIQAGVGLFILLVGSALLRLDTLKVNAIKLPLTLTFTLPALLLFIYADMVAWIPGLILAVGTLLGTRIGVRLSIRGGHKLILRSVTVVLLVTGVNLLVVRPSPSPSRPNETPRAAS